MNKKTYIGIGMIIIGIVIICLALCSSRGTEGPRGKLMTGSPEETFSGTITGVDTGCFVDATCSVTVDGKKIILVQGRMMSTTTPVVGRLIGVESVGDLEKRMGDHANVYATTTSEGNYTIYGNENYYVEVISKK